MDAKNENGASGLPRESYAFGPFCLNEHTRELQRDGTVVPLTPKAHDTLAVLIAFRHRVVEKAELLQRVWPDAVVGEETLTQNVATLRRALGDNPDQPAYIATIPRHGYRFVAPVRVVTDQPLLPAADAVAVSAEARWLGRFTVSSAIATLALIGGLAAGWIARDFGRPPIRHDVTRFLIAPPQGTAFSVSASFPAVSPNGRLVAFLAGRPGEPVRLWVRPLDSLAARELAGTDGAVSPFWSPDSESLAFVAGKQLKTVNLLGAPPRTLYELEGTFTPSGTWNRDGVILFSNRSAIYRIAAEGGAATAVTSVDAARGETVHILPQFLPDGRSFVYVGRGPSGTATSWIVLGSLGSSEHQRLLHSTSQATYVEPGYLLFVVDGALMAQRFDLRTRQLRDVAVPIGADSVDVNPANARAMFSASDGGTLAYRVPANTELGWFDRAGTPLGWLGGTAQDNDLALSPDGTRLAVSRYDATSGTRNLWMLDLTRGGQASMFTSQLSWASCPVWSRDGRRIAFALGAPNAAPLYERAVSDNVEASSIAGHPTGCPVDWMHTPDSLVYVREDVESSQPTVAYVADRARTVAVPGPWASRPWPRVSPDGRWLAFVSERSGHREVYVEGFPGGDPGPVQVSSRGGIEPQWRGDGRELYFLGLDRQLMAVPITGGASLHAGTPTALFLTRTDASGVRIIGRNQYVVTADGQKFLIKQARSDAPESIHVVLNWSEMLKK